MINVELNEKDGTVTLDNGVQYMVLEVSQAREIIKEISKKLTKYNIQENRKIFGYEKGSL